MSRRDELTPAARAVLRRVFAAAGVDLVRDAAGVAAVRPVRPVRRLMVVGGEQDAFSVRVVSSSRPPASGGFLIPTAARTAFSGSVPA